MIDPKITNEAVDKFKAAVLRCAETPVTPEMIAAGLAAMSDDPMVTDRYDAERLYRAMDAHRPVELISKAEDALRRENARLYDALKARTDERDTWGSIATTYGNRIGELESYSHAMAVAYDEHKAQLAARDARIRELDDLLAQRPAPVPDTPKPAHDFTRVEGGDRRMLGR
jgi:hypothetical protein